MRTSDALCRATPPRDAGSLPAPRSAPCSRAVVRRHTFGATSRQARRARRRFRATDTGRTRAPSIGSTRISRSEQAAALVVHFTRRRLAPCRSPRAWATSSKDGWSPRAIPPLSGARFATGCPAPTRSSDVDEKDASHRLLQPTYDPSTLRTARFPGTLRAALAGPRGLSARRSRRPTLGQWPPVSPQVKLRLTANLQLQPCHNPSRSAHARVTPNVVVGVMPRGPGGASIERSSRAAPPGCGVFNREPSLRRSL